MDATYDKRPWLKNYPEWTPHDLVISDDTALSDFKNAASKKSEAPAVFYFDHTLSYGEIDQLSDSLASGLYSLGMRKGERMVVDLQNVPQFLVATYATWKLGAIVVPLNPMYKERELTYFCRDSAGTLLPLRSR